MADLEAAADRALVRVMELKERVHEAEEALEELDEETSRLDERLDDEADALREQARALQERAAEERQRVDREVEESARALDGVEEAAQAATADCDREAAVARREILELEERAGEGLLRVDESGRALSTSLAELESRVAEVERSLEAALEEAAGAVHSMDARLRTLTEEVQQHAAEVEHLLGEECPAQVAQAREAYAAGLDDIDQRLTEQFEAQGPPLEGTCELACESSSSSLDAAYPEFHHETAIQDVGDLGLAALTHESELANVDSSRDAAVEAHCEAAQAAVDSLDTAMEVLASYGYA